MLTVTEAGEREIAVEVPGQPSGEHNRSVAREAVLATTTVDVPQAGLP